MKTIKLKNSLNNFDSKDLDWQGRLKNSNKAEAQTKVDPIQVLPFVPTEKKNNKRKPQASFSLKKWELTKTHPRLLD